MAANDLPPAILTLELPSRTATTPPAASLTVTVRPYHTSDAASVSYHASNTRIGDNLRDSMPQPYTVADAEKWIAHATAPTTDVCSGAFDTATGTGVGPAVPVYHVIAVDGEAVGSVGLTFGDAQNVYKRTAEVGYWLSEQYWGRGILSVVLPAYVQWAFATFGRLMRLDGSCYGWNEASAKVMIKAGFVYEGRKRANVWKGGRTGDELFYGLLREDVMGGR